MWRRLGAGEEGNERCRVANPIDVHNYLAATVVQHSLHQERMLLMLCSTVDQGMAAADIEDDETMSDDEVDDDSTPKARASTLPLPLKAEVATDSPFTTSCHFAPPKRPFSLPLSAAEGAAAEGGGSGDADAPAELAIHISVVHILQHRLQAMAL